MSAKEAAVSYGFSKQVGYKINDEIMQISKIIVKYFEDIVEFDIIDKGVINKAERLCNNITFNGGKEALYVICSKIINKNNLLKIKFKMPLQKGEFLVGFTNNLIKIQNRNLYQRVRDDVYLSINTEDNEYGIFESKYVFVCLIYILYKIKVQSFYIL